MNLAEQVSNSLTGNSSITISMNGRSYIVRPPKTRLVAAMLKPLSKINIDIENNSVMASIKESANQYVYADEAIAIAILGDDYFKPLSKLKMWWLKRVLSLSSDEERFESLKNIVSIIIPTGFFCYARLVMELTGTMTQKQK